MKSNTIALLVLLILVGGGLLFLLVGGDGGSLAPSMTDPLLEEPVDDVPDIDLSPEEIISQSEDPRDLDSGNSGQRSLVTGREVDNGADQAQGAMGQVTDMGGIPQSGIHVYLVEAITNPIVALQQKQKGRVIPFLARDRTGEDGRFALGVKNLREEKLYNLYFVDEDNRFVDRTIPNVTLRTDEWYESDQVRLRYGQIVEGVVRSQANGGTALEGAAVTIRGSNNQISLTPIPNREQGLVAITDSKGYYRFRNAPKDGIFTITAVAAEHAMVARHRLRIKAGQANRFDFDLPSGLTITGVVTDSEGSPIANAAVRTRALSTKTAIGDDKFTDEDGRFELIGLAEGPYGLTVVSPNYGMYHLKGIEAGVKEHHIVLESKGSARLRVLGANGRTMSSFRAHIKRSSAKANGTLTNLSDQAMVTVTSRDLEDGVYILGGLDEGTYAFEVHARGYAKTYSEPFQVKLNKPDPEVSVKMQKGGSLVGSIVDANGRGISGATITTLPNAYMENAITEMFGALIQTTITRKSTKSKGGGNFTLDALAPGTYQLKVQHEDFTWQFLTNYEVLPNRKSKVSPIVMPTGARLVGRAMINGRPAAQIKVQVYSRGDDNKPSDTPFSASAVTDVNGFFSIRRRLHPDKYQASASQATASNIFAQFADEKQTTQKFTIVPGQTEHRLDFYIHRN